MSMRRLAALALCVLVLAWGGAYGAEATFKDAVRAVVGKHEAAVVSLKIVTSVKVTYQGREMPAREQESEVLGTVLDDTGLIVASNTAVNPADAQAAENPGLAVESEVKSAKLIPGAKGGTELPLKIVFRDKDLDLVFLRPETKTALPNVGLKQAGPELDILDNVILLTRLGAVGDRQPAVSVGAVHAVVKKPRRLYVLGLLDSVAALGCPVFDLEGGLAGIVVLRISRSGGSGGLLGAIGSRMLPTVLPVADILEDMKQIEK